MISPRACADNPFPLERLAGLGYFRYFPAGTSHCPPTLARQGGGEQGGGGERVMKSGAFSKILNADKINSHFQSAHCATSLPSDYPHSCLGSLGPSPSIQL